MENMQKMTDDALVALYSKGNNQAFDILLERYKDKLYSYIHFSVRRSKYPVFVTPTLHKAAANKAAGSCYKYFLHSLLSIIHSH